MSDTEDKTQRPKLPPKNRIGRKTIVEVGEIPFNDPETAETLKNTRDLLDGIRDHGSETPPWRRRSQKRPDEILDNDPITLSFRMTGKDLKRINSLTQYLAISKSDFFREAINKLLEQEESFVAKELQQKGEDGSGLDRTF